MKDALKTVLLTSPDVNPQRMSADRFASEVASQLIVLLNHTRKAFGNENCFRQAFESLRDDQIKAMRDLQTHYAERPDEEHTQPILASPSPTKRPRGSTADTEGISLSQISLDSQGYPAMLGRAESHFTESDTVLYPASIKAAPVRTGPRHDDDASSLLAAAMNTSPTPATKQEVRRQRAEAKGSPKAKASPKKKAAPKAKASPQKKAAPKAKAKASPKAKAKANPKAKTSSNANVCPKAKAKPQASFDTMSEAAPQQAKSPKKNKGKAQASRPATESKDWGKMWYKNASCVGIRAKHPPQNQIFSFRSRNAKCTVALRRRLLDIGDQATHKLREGHSETEVAEWAKSQV